MTADLQDHFDQAGRNPPAPTLDPGAVLHRARRIRNRRITAAVAAAAVVTLAVGLGLASHRREPAPPPPATHPQASLGRLAYGINGDLFLADADGQHPVRIADGVPNGVPRCGQYGQATWSPDGRHLAYRVEVPSKGGRCQTFVDIADPAGHRLASFPGRGWLISWSPDSTRVATWVDLFHTIGIYGLDGTRQALLTLPPGLMPGGDFDPVWAPDGKSLLVPFGVQIPLDGSAPQQLAADDPRSHSNFVFSPDGSQVAHFSRDGALSLHVAAADGSHARLLIPRNVQNPIWSPTGDQIAFESPTGHGTTNLGPATELRVVDVDDGAVTSLAGRGGTDTLSLIQFSPEGDQILFARTDTTGASSLWSVHLDGSGPHLLVAGSDGGAWQAVSPAR